MIRARSDILGYPLEAEFWTENGRVMHANRAGRWALGKSVEDVYKFYRMLGAKIILRRS